MTTKTDRPLVLNFGQPFNEVCRLQLDRELPGWVEWRHPHGYRVERPDQVERDVEAWLAALATRFPDWTQRKALYATHPVNVAVSTAVRRFLLERHGVRPVAIIRNRFVRSPLECFGIVGIGDRILDPHLQAWPDLQATLINLGRKPLLDEQVEQVRQATPGFRLDVVHHPLPCAADNMGDAAIDDFLLDMARQHKIDLETHPCLLAWFHHAGLSSNAIRLVARLHGVMGYFVPLVRFRLQERFAGFTEPEVLHDLHSYDVDGIYSFAEERNRAAHLRDRLRPVLEGLSEPGLSPSHAEPAPPLPSAVALVALQWPRWVNLHSQEDAQRDGPDRGREHLERLDGHLQPGNVPATEAGLPADILQTMDAFKHVAPAALAASPRAFLSSLGTYIVHVGECFEVSHVATPWTLRGRLKAFQHEGLAVDFEAPDLSEMWPRRRLAMDGEALLAFVVRGVARRAVAATASRLIIAASLDGRGDERSWSLEVRHDGEPMGDTILLLESDTSDFLRDLEAFAARHLASLRIVTSDGSGRCVVREKHGGIYHWDAPSRNSLDVVTPPQASWQPAEPCEALQAPWRTSLKVTFLWEALGDPAG